MAWSRIRPVDRETILRHNWWGHDGRWYMFTAKEMGFERANEMNMTVNKAVGKMEIRNLMALSAMSKEFIRENLVETLSMNLELCAKDVFQIRDFRREGSCIVLRIDRCAAHLGTQKAGYKRQYRCACFKRCEGWFEAVGLSTATAIQRSLLQGDPFCEIVMTPDP